MKCETIKYICKKRRDKNKKKNKSKVKMCLLGSRLFFKKNTIVVWNQLRIIVSMLGSRGVPSLQSFSSVKRAFSLTLELSKVMHWLNDQVCFTMFDSLAHVLTFLARVVRKVDNAIHRINHYPVDSVVCFVNTSPLDSDLSSG